MRRFYETALILIGTLGWWGFVYPELSAVTEPCVQEEVQEEIQEEDQEEVSREIPDEDLKESPKGVLKTGKSEAQREDQEEVPVEIPDEDLKESQKGVLKARQGGTSKEVQEEAQKEIQREAGQDGRKKNREQETTGFLSLAERFLRDLGYTGVKSGDIRIKSRIAEYLYQEKEKETTEKESGYDEQERTHRGV